MTSPDATTTVAAEGEHLCGLSHTLTTHADDTRSDIMPVRPMEKTDSNRHLERSACDGENCWEL